MAIIRVGTAGWSIPAALKSRFSDAGTQLEKYGARLNAVEINSSFYRPHQRKTYQRWAQSVPDDFRFSVKLPRSITHERRLEGFEGPLARFADEVSGLGGKLGVILVQLPPSLPSNADLAEAFFAALPRGPGFIACEPRHEGWFCAQAEALMIRYDIARVAADPPRHVKDGMVGGARRLAYYRWHGSPKIYWSAYDAARLAALANEVRHHAPQSTWCIFDNTAAGAALDNALQLMTLTQ